MDIQISETERRIAGNLEVLAEVEAEIVLLEKSIAELGSLETEKDRLSTAVQALTEEETRILGDDGSGSETALVKRLSELRTKRDVQSARLINTKDKIEAHTVELAEQGAAVRKAFAGVMAQLWTARRQRMTAILTELFGAPMVRLKTGRIEMPELLDQTVPMKHLKDSRNRFVQTISDPAQEKLALQRTRSWLAEVKELIESEPDLTLRSVKPSIEQRQPAEMATA